MDSDYDFVKLQRVGARGVIMLVPPRFKLRYDGGGYEHYTAGLFLRFLRPGDRVIDVGAHLGYYSLLAARGVGSRGQVWAFEPLPENVRIFKKNIRLNKLKNVTIFNTAVSDQSGVRSFNKTAASDSAGFYSHPLTQTLMQIPVETVTLDRFTGNHEVDIIKIDVEGHEKKVLEGMHRLLASSPNLKLFLEFNPACLESAGENPTGFLNFLDRELDLDVYGLDDELDRWFGLNGRTDSWAAFLQGKAYFNLYCRRKSHQVSTLFVSHSSEAAGAERTLKESVEVLEKNGHLCAVVIPGDGWLSRNLSPATPKETIPLSWWAADREKADNHILEALSVGWEHLGELVRIINYYQPQVVVTNSLVVPWGALAAAVANKPHVWFVHEFGQADYNFRFFPGYPYFLQFVDRLSNLVVASSRAVAEYLSQVVPAGKIATLGCGVTIQVPRVRAGSYFRRRHSLKLLLLGTICPAKGQRDAVEAVKILSQTGVDVELILAGPVADRAYLKSITDEIKASHLANSIQVLPYQDNVAPLITTADVVLVCSVKEAFGRVTLEAMRLGRPVIGSRSGGTPELIRDRHNGLLYNPSDVSDLAAKIEYFYARRQLLKVFGQRARSFAAKHYPPELYATRLLANLMAVKKQKPLMSGYAELMLAYGLALEAQATKARQGQLRLAEAEKTIGRLEAELADYSQIKFLTRKLIGLIGIGVKNRLK